MEASATASDPWASWVLEQDAGTVADVRDRLLDAGQVGPDQLVLDLGCGDGLVAFGALERGARVIFSDVSPALLDHCRSRLQGNPSSSRASFLQARAEDLAAIRTQSIDVVTCRSVLIYVEDKRQAISEAFRVLKPGGRLALFEPINAFARLSPPGTFCGYELSEIEDLAAKVRGVWQTPNRRSMLDFDERDLFQIADESGFGTVQLTLELALKSESWLTGEWVDVCATRPNPVAPSLREAIAEALSRKEAERFESVLRPLVQAGQARARSAHAFLSAVKIVRPRRRESSAARVRNRCENAVADLVNSDVAHTHRIGLHGWERGLTVRHGELIGKRRSLFDRDSL